MRVPGLLSKFRVYHHNSRGVDYEYAHPHQQFQLEMNSSEEKAHENGQIAGLRHLLERNQILKHFCHFVLVLSKCKRILGFTQSRTHKFWTLQTYPETISFGCVIPGVMRRHVRVRIIAVDFKDGINLNRL